MRIGFAGLGRMGAHMARNLAIAGHELTIWNRTAEKAAHLAAEIGAAQAETPADLARNADIVVTMLADDASSAAVHGGPDGLFSEPVRTIFLEMGTMSPAHIQELAVNAPAGSRVIDAPVSGATQAAKEAQLLIMAGCNRDEATVLLPVLDALGRKTIFLGSPGMGTVMKLAVNSLIHGLNQSLAEAMALAEAAGVKRKDAFDIIEESAAAAPMIKYRRPLYLDESAHDVTFTVALARKDMEVTAALARELGVQMPQGLVTLAKLTAAENSGYAMRDMASMLEFMRKGRE